MQYARTPDSERAEKKLPPSFTRVGAPGTRAALHDPERVKRPGVRDLRLIGDDREAIKRELGASYPYAKSGTVAAWAGVLLRFAFEPMVGDLLAHPERQTNSVSIGRIESEYFWEAPDQHCRRVEWLARRVPRREFSESARKELSARVAFFVVRHHAAEVAAHAADHSSNSAAS